MKDLCEASLISDVKIIMFRVDGIFLDWFHYVKKVLKKYNDFKC